MVVLSLNENGREKMANCGKARGLWIWEGKCWDSEIRWIWSVWIELKNRCGKRCNVCYERGL